MSSRKKGASFQKGTGLKNMIKGIKKLKTRLKNQIEIFTPVSVIIYFFAPYFLLLRTPDVVIVSIRGTKLLYEWLIRMKT